MEGGPKLSFSSISRAFAVGHFVWAVGLWVAAAYTSWITISIAREAGPGAPWWPSAAFLGIIALIWVVPPALLGTWLWNLGRNLWTPRRARHGWLVATHVFLFAFGLLSVALGTSLLHAARHQYSPDAVLAGGFPYPLGVGIFFLVIAVTSFIGLFLVPDLGGASQDSRP